MVHLFQIVVPMAAFDSRHQPERFQNSFENHPKYTLDYIIKETGCKPEEIAIVGDRLYTDIAVADGSEVTSILVLWRKQP